MKVVSVNEVIERNKESIEAVTALVGDWLKLIQEAALVPESDVELVIMPMPYMIDEREELVQGLVFYDEDTDTPTQIQLAGIWLAGAMWTDDDDEEYLEVFQPGDERFARSVIETLTMVMLEVRVALKGGLAMEARDAVRDQLRGEAQDIVAELLGPPPDAWLAKMEKVDKVFN